MPTATLRFKLPDERIEYEQASNGSKAIGVLYEMDQTMRGWLKYGFPDNLMRDRVLALVDGDAAVEFLRDELNRLCCENGINICE